MRMNNTDAFMYTSKIQLFITCPAIFYFTFILAWLNVHRQQELMVCFKQSINSANIWATSMRSIIDLVQLNSKLFSLHIRRRGKRERKRHREKKSDWNRNSRYGWCFNGYNGCMIISLRFKTVNRKKKKKGVPFVPWITMNSFFN